MIYTHAQARALHHAPLAIALLRPPLSSAAGSGSDGQRLGWGGLAGGTLLALASVLGAILLPVAVGAGRAIASGECARR